MSPFGVTPVSFWLVLEPVGERILKHFCFRTRSPQAPYFYCIPIVKEHSDNRLDALSDVWSRAPDIQLFNLLWR
jgi:hypothetical protein